MALTASQKTTLKNDIIAKSAPGGPLEQPVANNDDVAIAQYYNTAATPSFTVWKSNVLIAEVGKKINGTELAGLTQANLTRLQTIAIFCAPGVNPSLPDHRAFFDDVFSGAGGTITRPALLALWKRLASNVEKLLATGTGTDPSPATLQYEGPISYVEISEARTS
jgi:hypothetical protein